MGSSELEELIRRAEQLPLEEQLYLIAYLADRARARYRPGVRGPGLFPDPPPRGEALPEWLARLRRNGSAAEPSPLGHDTADPPGDPPDGG